MRGWVATATLVPYIASVVEVAFGGVGGAASDFGLVGGGELRRDGSDWTWLCHSVGLWPMANSKGRWCGCMDPDQGFAWAWAIIALALFGMGGDGPCRPGLSNKDGGESAKESKIPKSGKFWRYFSWSAWVESALSRPSSNATKGKSGKESAGEGSMPAAPSEIQPAVDDRDERVSGSTKMTGQKNLPGGSHDVRVGLLQKLRSEEEMVRTGGNSPTADLQRLLRDAETRGSASGVWVSRGEVQKQAPGCVRSGKLRSHGLRPSPHARISAPDPARGASAFHGEKSLRCRKSCLKPSGFRREARLRSVEANRKRTRNHGSS